MSFASPRTIRQVYGIAPEEDTSIRVYLRSLVNEWIDKQSAKHFAARDLVGGGKVDWLDTPLKALIAKHTAMSKSEKAVIKGASRDLGWLLLRMLDVDEKLFERVQSKSPAMYFLVVSGAVGCEG